jgi:hypothetical protein
MHGKLLSNGVGMTPTSSYRIPLHACCITKKSKRNGYRCIKQKS